MEIVITADYEEMSKVSAQIIAREIRRKHDLVLGLATGDSPVGTYRELARIHRTEGLDFSKIKTFNLDEYIGLAPLHKNSYNAFMMENLFNHININKENVYVPQGNIDDPEEFVDHISSVVGEEVVEGGEELEVLPPGEPPVEGPLVGGDEAYRLPNPSALLLDVESVYSGFAPSREDQGAEDLDQRRLPGAVRAEDPEDLSFSDQ